MYNQKIANMTQKTSLVTTQHYITIELSLTKVCSSRTPGLFWDSQESAEYRPPWFRF